MPITLQAFAFGFGGRRRAFAQGNNKVLRTTVTQVQCVGVALATVAEDGNLLVLDQVHIAIAVVINAHFHSPMLVSGAVYAAEYE